MWTDQVILNKRKPAIVRACRMLLSERGPVDLSVLFPMDGIDGKPVLTPVDSPMRLWQKRVMTILVAKGFVARQHNPGVSPHPRYFVRHPKLVQDLLEEDEAGKESLNEVVLKAFSKSMDDNSDLYWTSEAAEPEEPEVDEDEAEDEAEDHIVQGKNVKAQSSIIDAGTGKARLAIISFLEGRNVVTTSDIGTQVLGYEDAQINTYVLQQVGSVLRELGWKKGQSRGSYGVKSRRIWIREGHDQYEDQDALPDVPMAAVVPAVHPNPVTADIIALLKMIQDTVVYTKEVQERLAENIIYMRDRGNQLHDKILSVESRLSALEARPEAPSVNSIRDAVREALDAKGRQEDIGALKDALVSSDRISAEISQLCAVAREIASGVKDG